MNNRRYNIQEKRGAGTSADELAAAMERGKALDMDTVVQKLLTEDAS